RSSAIGLSKWLLLSRVRFLPGDHSSPAQPLDCHSHPGADSKPAARRLSDPAGPSYSIWASAGLSSTLNRIQDRTAGPENVSADTEMLLVNSGGAGYGGLNRKTPSRDGLGLFCKIGNPTFQVEHRQLDQVFNLIPREGLAFGNSVPLRDATTTTGRCCMLRIMYRIRVG